MRKFLKLLIANYMKACFLFLLFFINFYPAIGQKVIYDKTDPFTKERNISVGNSRLSNILQSGVSAKISDSARTFFISFITPAVPGLKVETVDSIKKECKFKTANGQIITGQWHGKAEAMGYTVNTYSILEDHFKSLAFEDISVIKTDERLFEINPKNRSKLAKLCNQLLSKLNH